MRHWRKISNLSAFSVGLAAFTLSACSVGTPASLTSTDSDPRYVTNVALVSEDGNVGLRSQFLRQLNRALSNRGVGVDPNSRFVADFAISQRSADLELQQIPHGSAPQTASNGASTAQEDDPFFRPEWFDKCKPDRVSASLVVYAREDGKVQAKSSGEFLACPGDLSQLDDLAQLLVDRTFRK